MNKLEIVDLHVEVDGKEILQGVTLTFDSGKVYALMGPNGSGKSTLAHALMGHPRYKITKGQILLNGKDLINEKPHLRAREGLFLSFQYPAEVPGVNMASFLRTAVNGVSGKNYSVVDFHKLLKEKMNLLKMDSSFTKRSLNQDFSGGEKKRMEILQLLLLQPKFGILDEPDSGTDVDALRIIAEGINNVKESVGTGLILITHYNKILNYIKPDEVIVLVNGRVVDIGDAKIAEQIESNGYNKYISKERGIS